MPKIIDRKKLPTTFDRKNYRQRLMEKKLLATFDRIYLHAHLKSCRNGGC